MTWTLRGSAGSQVGVQCANLSGSSHVCGSEQASEGAIVTENQSVAHRVLRRQRRRRHGHTGQHAGERLIRRRRHDVRDRGGDVGEARRITALGPDGGKLAQREDPGEQAVDVAERESGRAGFSQACLRRTGTFAIEERPDRLP
jgi:hypothetical protein